MPVRPRRLAVLILLGLLVPSLAACGRRGGLQAPDSAVGVERSSSQAATASPRALPQGIGLANGTAAPDPDAVRDGDELATAATPAANDGVPVQTARGAKRGYAIPKQPFFLDPIL